MAISRVSRTTWADHRPGPGAFIWLVLFATIGVSGFIAVSGLVEAARESGQDLVLTGQPSALNYSDLALAPVPTGDRAKVSALHREMRAGSVTWLLDHAYPDGSYPAGDYALAFYQDKS